MKYRTKTGLSAVTQCTHSFETEFFIRASVVKIIQVIYGSTDRFGRRVVVVDILFNCNSFYRATFGYTVS